MIETQKVLKGQNVELVQNGMEVEKWKRDTLL